MTATAEQRIAAQQEAEAAARSHGARDVRIRKHFHRYLKKFGITSGTILEIGGRRHPISDYFQGSYHCVAMDLTETGPDVIVADITSCPQIAAESFDAVYSVDVFEHIDRPWLAAAEIARLLKPGGIAYTSTLFSWRYHPCPIDYWRFTPPCLKFLFADLETLGAAFDTVERRSGGLGNGKFKLEPDAFGGWRENWRVFHVGRKKLTGEGA